MSLRNTGCNALHNGGILPPAPGLQPAKVPTISSSHHP